MRTLVLGGIRSGKSQWAEDWIGRAAGPSGPVRYVATGTAVDDADFAARVSAHRNRRPSHWSTVESADVASTLPASGDATMVDDIGGWLVATMDRRAAWTGGSIQAEVDELAAAVSEFTAPLALVSPEVGLTVVPATESGRRFTDELGSLNQRLAAVCDRVVLVVAGQPLTVKEPR
ncbi:bifunctional adenosylcobinamide kinase/adenosylcobinamide-phosphate guanylyltransferase [Mycolicibacterium sp. CBMA 226]|uniref:bifunctional adenosylcobinamide kinase/adenosylcobinamide-phosphate guanylyltransferase n=1 Tax=Mycolicibacterium sp. CBMA 226 TaxID=2606611 RepID=UPI00130A0630|nr:bifunctional adenosylcobinamide kinase/adenosylcobinamide-phosphate guanylyltransferase [Mycolicibacterium sp. CBMA 226]MUL75768.1 bifunctional adenosylcobinamide kinase/adenosylcobinamide-phosphate guanylyltransferase [Mycolicibacterium sp. CBMA 226]